jgi:DNA-binding CsgD family transcriptional regulator
MPDHPLLRADLESLLRIVTAADQQNMDVSERRTSLLTGLCELVGAAGGFWGWGRGRPGITAVTPVAAIPFGLTPTEWTAVASFCMSPEGHQLTQAPIYARMGTANQVTVARPEIVNEPDWHGSHAFQFQLRPIEIDEFASSVRYLSNDTWCCLSLFRRLGKPAFAERDTQLIDLAMAGVSWIAPQVSEAIPPEAFAGITERQRMVLMFLLDGLSRKQIAAHLGLALDTVNDHVKNLYQRFEVQSATELAARFLKSL